MANSALIEDLLKQFAENPRRVFARLANEYRKTGDLDQAIEICRAHVPLQPTYISGYIVLGQALFESKKLDEARSTFETALTLDPENLIALRQLGDIARVSGDVDARRTLGGEDEDAVLVGLGRAHGENSFCSLAPVRALSGVRCEAPECPGARAQPALRGG